MNHNLAQEMLDYILAAPDCEDAEDYVLGAINLAKKIKQMREDVKPPYCLECTRNVNTLVTAHNPLCDCNCHRGGELPF